MWRWPVDSLAAWPCRSICVVLLIDTTRSFCITTCGGSIRSTAWHRKSGLRSTVAYCICSPDAERADDLAGIQRLASARDDAGEVEIDDPVGEHLGVHAEVAHAALAQQRAHRVGHRSDADLQAAAVLDLRGDQLRDRAVVLRRRRVRDLGGGTIVPLDHEVDLALVHRVLEPVQVRQPADSSTTTTFARSVIARAQSAARLKL